MDSGIRSSTSGDLDGLTEDGSKGFFDGLLDRRVIGLALPAAVGGAEVTEVDTPTHGVKMGIFVVVVGDTNNGCSVMGRWPCVHTTSWDFRGCWWGHQQRLRRGLWLRGFEFLQMDLIQF